MNRIALVWDNEPGVESCWAIRFRHASARPAGESASVLDGAAGLDTVAMVLATWRGVIRAREAVVAEPRDNGQLAGRLAAVAALGFVLIIPPFLTQFDRVDRVFGVPVLWAYLYLVWATVIGLVAVTGARSR